MRSTVCFDIVFFFFPTELWRRDDLGDCGLYGHKLRPGVRDQGPTGGAAGLFRWSERHGPRPRTVRLHRRHGASYRPQTTAVPEIAASHR